MARGEISPGVCACGQPLPPKPKRGRRTLRCAACRKTRHAEYQRAYHQSHKKPPPERHCACGVGLTPPAKRCQACRTDHKVAYRAAWGIANRDKEKATKKVYLASNRDAIQAREKARYPRNKAKRKAARQAVYQQKLAEKRCGCGEPIPEPRVRFCSACAVERSRTASRQWRKLNPDKFRTSVDAAKAKKTEQYRTKRNASVRRLRRQNPEMQNAWRAAHPERRKEYDARYREKKAARAQDIL